MKVSEPCNKLGALAIAVVSCMHAYDENDELTCFDAMVAPQQIGIGNV